MKKIVAVFIIILSLSSVTVEVTENAYALTDETTKLDLPFQH